MNMGVPGFLMLLSVFAITGCGTTEDKGNSRTASNGNETVTDSTLIVLVDADYKISHGWGHVFGCKVKDVIRGELDDSVFGLSVYATVQLYDDLLRPFYEYHDLMMTFTLNPERRCGPPPGFRDSHGNYWELLSVSRPKDPFINLIPNTIYQYFPDLAGFNSTIATYAYDSFPTLRYSKTNPEEWSKGLKAIVRGDSNSGFVRVWRKVNKIEYVWITAPYPNGGEFYSFDNDMVDALYPINSRGYLFMTQVGITRWRYKYENGLLRKIVYYRAGTPSPIWAVDSVEYWPGSGIPLCTYRYGEPEDEDVSGKSWSTRSVHDKEGKITREEDSLGKVLWEKKTR